MADRTTAKWLVTGVLCGLLQSLCGLAQEPATGGGVAPALNDRQAAEEANTKTPGPAPNGKLPSEPAKAPPAHSAGVDEILKMSRAGVSAEVLKAYIEHSPIAYNLNGADIIALKEQGVPDEVTVSLVKRGAELTAQVNQINQGGPVPDNFPLAATPKTVNRALVARALRARSGPESYDFWWYHYAYPRALAAANERLSSAYAGFGPGPSYDFGPYADSWVSGQRRPYYRPR